MGRNSSHDDQERRAGKDRRELKYALHIPERRSGKERRKSSARKQNRKQSIRQFVVEKADEMIDEATLQHFILGMMTALSYPVFKRLKYPYLGLILIHSFIIEGVQFFMPDRTPDTADALVGLVGILLGFCLV